MAIGTSLSKAASPMPGLGGQHEHDLVGRVRRRRDGVGGEDRQGDALAQPLVPLLGRGDRPPDEDPLGERHHDRHGSDTGTPACGVGRSYTPPPCTSSIVGCGRVGSSLARALTADGHTVAIIDRRTEAFTRLGPDFAGTTVQGIGFDRDRLDRGRHRARPAPSPRSRAATTPTSSSPASPARTSASSRSSPASTTRAGP